MDNKLIKKDDGVIALVENKQLDDIIKPLCKEIHLFDTFISGTFRINEEISNNIKIGDHLILRREQNKFDENSIIIYDKDKNKIGYIPEGDNIIFAILMDAGKKLIARVKDIKTVSSFKQIEIGIYLVDF